MVGGGVRRRGRVRSRGRSGDRSRCGEAVLPQAPGSTRMLSKKTSSETASAKIPGVPSPCGQRLPPLERPVVRLRFAPQPDLAAGDRAFPVVNHLETSSSTRCPVPRRTEPGSRGPGSPARSGSRGAGGNPSARTGSAGRRVRRSRSGGGAPSPAHRLETVYPERDGGPMYTRARRRNGLSARLTSTRSPSSSSRTSYLPAAFTHWGGTRDSAASKSQRQGRGGRPGSAPTPAATRPPPPPFPAPARASSAIRSTPSSTAASMPLTDHSSPAGVSTGWPSASKARAVSGSPPRAPRFPPSGTPPGGRRRARGRRRGGRGGIGPRAAFPDRVGCAARHHIHHPVADGRRGDDLLRRR